MTNNSQISRQASWQAGFIALLPEIERLLQLSFHHLDPESREEAAQDGVAHSLIAYAQLFKKGRSELASASTLAWYASRQVLSGRQAACSANSKEPLSRYAQVRNGIAIKRLHVETRYGMWINEVVQDKRASVADEVAARLDIKAWLTTLQRRTRCIAVDLAKGFTTSEVAQKHSLSCGRISQVRKELKTNWDLFQGEPRVAF